MEAPQQNQIVLTPAQLPSNVFMVPMSPAQPPRPAPELKQETETFSVLGAFFWAVILLLAFWFITGGYETLK